MIDNNKIVALLPMKANSDRIKGKNFKSLAGKPLFFWILDTLLSIDIIDQIIINTDAKFFLQKHGLKECNRLVIYERASELCGDMVSMNKIISNDIEKFPSDIYLMTHTTNPLLSSETIKEAIGRFINGMNDYDSLFSVNKIQTRFYNEDVIPVNHDPNNLLRTQDLEPWFEENSCLYLFTEKSFVKTNARIGTKPMMYITPKLESIDIDEPEDWEIASGLLF